MLSCRATPPRGVTHKTTFKSIFHECYCVYCRPSAIQQQEFTVPSFHDSSPTKVVIKTNPLFRSTSPQQATPPDCAGMENSVPEGVGQIVFYGQRRKIRKTKEQEMINAVIDLTNHSESSITSSMVPFLVTRLVNH